MNRYRIVEVTLFVAIAVVIGFSAPRSAQGGLVLLNPGVNVNVVEGATGTLTFNFRNTELFPLQIVGINNLSISNSGDFHLFDSDQDYATVTSPTFAAPFPTVAAGAVYALNFTFTTPPADAAASNDNDFGVTTVKAENGIFTLGGLNWRRGFLMPPTGFTEFRGTITVYDNARQVPPPPAVPEPAAMTAFALGAVSAFFCVWKRRKETLMSRVSRFWSFGQQAE
jgi:hypothetical protein